MALVNGRPDFDEQSFGKKTGISKGTDIFSLGGDFFNVKTNLEERKVRDLSNYIDNFSDPITLNNIIEPNNVEITIDNFNTVELNFDRTELTNFAYFGSLRDKIQHSIINIVNKFPASLYVNFDYNDVFFTVLNYVYNPVANRASFKVSPSAITNNYNLNLSKIENSFLTTSTNLRDISLSFNKYSVWNFESEFSVLGFTGTTITDNYLYIEVLGNPFPSVNNNGLVNFHIKPNYDNYENFLKNLDDFEGYLLNRESNPKYSAVFKVPNVDNEGNTLLIDEIFVWKTTDGYNLDYSTYEFQLYLDSLIKLADSLDDYKTNLISRFLTTSAIKEFDTEDQRTDKLLRLYGKEFDEIKKYIDGLANITKVSYDKKDNMPDILVKNFARTLGWGTFTTVNENDLIKSFLGQDNKIILSGQTKNFTPAETDIELWRRMIINSAYLFKSKGTRECIDFLFKIVGAPKSLIEFNEYVYVAQNVINVDQVQNSEDLNYPFDVQGYPKTLPNSSDYYFQMNGGWISNKEIAPTNSKNYASVVGIHSGNYDGGSKYFKAFTDFNDKQGFELNRVVDNVKSWKSSENNHQNINRETNYDVQDNRLVLNSKEASIFMNPSRAVETDVYEYNKENGFVINPIALPYPYPNNELTRADVTKMSYIQYVDFIYSNYINAKNRKVIETFGNGYPTLKKLYEDYTLASGSKNLTTDKVIKFIDQIGDFWINLIEQFVPSTTIWQGGVVYRNTIFDRQKYDYKQGINDGSEFATEQPLQPDIIIHTSEVKGYVGLPYEGNIDDIVKANGLITNTIDFPNGEEPIEINENENILRVKPFFSSDILSLTQPCLLMEQVSKIVTGTTEPIKHDISLGDKEIDFTFDCNIDFFTSGGTFTYNIYKYDYVISEFASTLIYKKTLTSLTPISGEIFVNEEIDFPFVDGDYLVKPEFKYAVILTGTTHVNIYEHFKKLNEINLLSDTGFSLSGSTLIYDSLKLVQTQEYGIYDENNDYWFNIISPPYKPIINTGAYTSPTLSGATLVNTTIPIDVELQKIFYINEIPNGDIFLNINGNTLVKSLDIDFDDDGEYYCQIVGDTYKITLNPIVEVYTIDVMNVIYIKSDGATSFSSIHEDIISIPSGTTASSGVLFNTSTNKYEYYLPFVLEQDVNYEEMVVILNGVKLSQNEDYYMIGITPDKIIFSGILEIGDDILIYYPNSLDSDFYLASKTFVASWTVQNDDKDGLYTVEVSQNDDFSVIDLTKTTPYIIETTIQFNTYTLTVGDFIIPDEKYYYRIKSDKYNINLLGETTITTTYSNISYFLTDNRVLV